MRVLITGGLGYIGSHTSVELLGQEHAVLIIDNLENSQIGVLDEIERIAKLRPKFECVDIRDSLRLDRSLSNFRPEAVIHFAAKKDPQASISQPMAYYQTNVKGTLNLLNSMMKHGVTRFVFSSSAAVYGNPVSVPVREDSRTDPLTPYARSKDIMEGITNDLFTTAAGNSACILRYFNPAATHPSGRLSAYHPHEAQNLFPSLMRAVRLKKALTIHGMNLPTPDGTGVRDYIHVQDLASGHVSALGYANITHGCEIFNLGTGEGYSVRQVIEAFEESVGQSVPFEFGSARPGDPARSFADTEKAKRLLNWRPEHGLENMLADEWEAFDCASELNSGT